MVAGDTGSVVSFQNYSFGYSVRVTKVVVMAVAVRSPRVVAANSGKVKERRDVFSWQEDARR